MSKFIVCIDAGHGGHDPGAVGNGLQEKDIVLKLALLCAQLLDGHPYISIHLTRSEDVFLPIGTRVRLANGVKADAFISLHVNGWPDPRAHGFEIYSHSGPGGRQSAQIKEILHDNLAPLWVEDGSSNRGRKRAGYQVISDTSMPSVLIEHGFISNPHDASLLRRDDFIQAQAAAIVIGITKYADLMRGEETAQKSASARLYRVMINGTQIGAYRDAANIAALAKEQIQQGAQKIEIERV